MIAESLHSALRVLLAGLLFGAGLPAVFALGVRLWSVGSPETATDGQVVHQAGRRNPAALVGAWICFAVVAVAVAIGVLWITQKSIDHYFGITLF